MGLTNIGFSRYTRWLSNVILLLLAWRQHPATPFRKAKQFQGSMTEHMSFRIHWIAAFASFQTLLCQNGIYCPRMQNSHRDSFLALLALSHCRRGRSLPHSSPLHQQPENRSRPITKTMQSLLEILGHPNYKKTHIRKTKNNTVTLLQPKSD